MPKGSEFERTIAKYLTNWLTGQRKEYYFWRTPASGALSTIAEQQGMTGDIISVKDEARILTDVFSIELKTGYPQASIDKHLKDNKNNQIQDFWEQSCKDADRAKKFPMLIYRKKGMKPWVGISRQFFEEFEMDRVYASSNHLSHLAYITLSWGMEDGKMIMNDVLMLFDMDQFFAVVTPEILTEWQK